MKLTTAQHAQLERVKKAADKLREAKATANTRFRLLVDQETAANQYEMDRQIRLAIEARIPKSQIGELGLGTKSPNPVYESLKRTEALAAQIAELEPVHVERFTWADDDQTRVRITLAGTEWDARLAEMQPKLRKHHDANMAEYRIVDGEFIARSDMYDRTTENAYDHPVTAWLLYSGGLSEVQAWISAQGEGIAA